MQLTPIPLGERGRILLAIFSANLLIALTNDPSNAYEGFFEMIGRAAQSVSQGNSPAVPPPSQQLQETEQQNAIALERQYQRDVASSNPIVQPMGTPYNAASFVDDAKLKRVKYLAFPQSRRVMDQLLGTPLAAAYSGTNGYEEYRLERGGLMSISYRNHGDPDQARWQAESYSAIEGSQ